VPHQATASDLVGRQFHRNEPDRLWVTEITEHPTREGKLYCAVGLDVFSRRVVGWSIDSRQETSLGGRPAGWMRELTGRSPMKSPGAPSLRREVERQFWCEIASGVTTDVAANAVGVSPAVGARWFCHRGGMPIDLSPTTGRHLSFREREEIAILRVQGAGVREIGRQLKRAPSTISRELRRNAATRGGKLEYRASVAQWKAELVAQRPKTAKLVANEVLRDYVQERLAGQVHRPDGTAADIEFVVWTPRQRGKPHRKDRRWVSGWSPEQIANRLKVDFPNDESMRISHEAIYQSLYVQSRGALKRELVACLRTGRALRVPRSRARRQAWAHVTPDERPTEADDRAIPGHWEGDLLIGLERSAIGTLVERTSRFTMLIHLPREEGYHHKHTPKNGPGPRRLRRDHDERRSCLNDHDAPRTTASISDLGPRERGVRTRPVQSRDRYPCLLRRSPQPVAARHKREHQRTLAPILPEGHRPVPMGRRRDRGRRSRSQHEAPQDTRMEDTRRDTR
jgi:IS30 family transposase